MSRKNLSKVFKAEAVKLLEESGRPAADVARELGIRRNQLYKWQEQFEQKEKGFFLEVAAPGRDPKRSSDFAKSSSG